MLCLWCNECCTCASCTYVLHMCNLLPYLIYAQHVCYLCTQHVLLAHIHATGMLHKCFLHVCMLQRAAYMPLAHMQATSIPHMCSTHTIWMYCVCSTCAAYMHSMCSKEADIYTSNISVRISMGTLTIQWYCACAQSRCIAIVHRELF